ncbi:MAG TPA: hypothetical protein VMU80_26285 [Bryobacteraceae bacterium]|nr:hypothetical protein [Bryobacteraceae bacterium]
MLAQARDPSKSAKAPDGVRFSVADLEAPWLTARANSPHAD